MKYKLYMYIFFSFGSLVGFCYSPCLRWPAEYIGTVELENFRGFDKRINIRRAYYHTSNRSPVHSDHRYTYTRRVHTLPTRPTDISRFFIFLDRTYCRPNAFSLKRVVRTTRVMTLVYFRTFVIPEKIVLVPWHPQLLDDRISILRLKRDLWTPIL